MKQLKRGNNLAADGKVRIGGIETEFLTTTKISTAINNARKPGYNPRENKDNEQIIRQTLRLISSMINEPISRKKLLNGEYNKYIKQIKQSTAFFESNSKIAYTNMRNKGILAHEVYHSKDMDIHNKFTQRDVDEIKKWLETGNRYGLSSSVNRKLSEFIDKNNIPVGWLTGKIDMTYAQEQEFLKQIQKSADRNPMKKTEQKKHAKMQDILEKYEDSHGGPDFITNDDHFTEAETRADEFANKHSTGYSENLKKFTERMMRSNIVSSKKKELSSMIKKVSRGNISEYDDKDLVNAIKSGNFSKAKKLIDDSYDTSFKNEEADARSRILDSQKKEKKSGSSK